MPLAIRKPCNHPGCPALIHRSERFCPVHKQEHYKNRRERAEPRTSPRERGYSPRWDRFSQWMRQKYPICQCCDREFAAVVDHIVPKSAGGLDNEIACWTLCKRCHDIKTARFDGGHGRKVSRIYCGKHAHDPQHMYLLKKYLREEIGHAKN